jgi:hypothetical protein
MHKPGIYNCLRWLRSSDSAVCLLAFTNSARTGRVGLAMVTPMHKQAAAHCHSTSASGRAEAMLQDSLGVLSCSWGQQTGPNRPLCCSECRSCSASNQP